MRCRPFFRSVFVRNGFGDYCSLRFLSCFALGFRFSPKSGFRIRNLMWFAFSPVSLRKICSSAIRVCLILLGVFGFDRDSFWFCDFLLLFVRFCGLLYTPMLPTLNIIRPRDFELGQLKLCSSTP